ncbi:hypothetical protein EJ04DRAFT_239295 [Polyplosphaeria fusca]|uniref:Uncharacterized protein n=1 Tax=Polyplosphaeria fusca TaxID=682080 RepID=A0A9P4RBJ7_9PLEO|nr:hypothetical protein EJ04DRAFT_239295 [Polyplosphaeria fusca]
MTWDLFCRCQAFGAEPSFESGTLYKDRETVLFAASPSYQSRSNALCLAFFVILIYKQDIPAAVDAHCAKLTSIPSLVSPHSHAWCSHRHQNAPTAPARHFTVAVRSNHETRPTQLLPAPPAPSGGAWKPESDRYENLPRQANLNKPLGMFVQSPSILLSILTIARFT